MKQLAWILVLVVTPVLAAQVPEDSGAPAPENQAEAQQLRQEIRKRWTEHVRTTLGLSAWRVWRSMPSSPRELPTRIACGS